MKYHVGIALLVGIIALGGLASPELRQYALGLTALLMVTLILISRLQRSQKQQEDQASQAKEETLIFLSTVVKPDLEKLAETTQDPQVTELLTNIRAFITKNGSV